MSRVVTFGELMVRLQPFNYERFAQANTLECTFGGGDAVASSVIKQTIHGDGNIIDDVESIRNLMNMNYDIKR